MTRLKTIHDLDSLRRLEPDWLRLWALAPRPEIFSHPSWALQFLTTYGSGNRIHTVVALASDGTVCGLLPLFQDSGGWLKFIGDPRSDYSDALCDPQDAAEIVPLLLSAIPNQSALRLHALPDHSLLLTALAAQSRQPYSIEKEEPCPAIIFDSAGLVAEGLLKKESLRRHEKKVAKLGPVRLEKLLTPASALQALPILFNQHVARWRSSPTPSLFQQPEHRLFYQNLVTDPDLWPLLDFRVLYAGDKAVAAHFGFLTGNRMLWYKPSFDPEFAPLGPGEVLLKHLVEAAVAAQASELDFTRGNEAFKHRFANATRWNHLVHRPNLTQRLHALARAGRDWTRRKLPSMYRPKTATFPSLDDSNGNAARVPLALGRQRA